MEHRKYAEMLYLYSAGEANNEQKEIIRKHLSECQACREELDYYYHLNQSFSNSPGKSVPEDLLVKARTELRGRIRIERSRENPIDKFINNTLYFFRNNYKYALNGAAGIAAGLIIGFFIFKGNSAADFISDTSGVEVRTVASSVPEEFSSIRNIRLNDADPYDDHIELSFDAVKQVNISGSINDENIRNFLLYAILNGNNPGVRLNSLNLLNASGQMQFDSEIKEAIISAVRYDQNPGVRREALKVLQTFPFDQDVKRSYIHIILNDSSSAMRIDAINHLIDAQDKGALLSGEEQELFRERIMQDDNNYIRLRARAVLGEKNL
jgi:hypothetical protein